MRDTARMEWIKLRSLRSTYWLLVCVVLAMVGAGTAVGIGYRAHTPVASAAQIVSNGLSGAVLAQLLMGALGVLTMTGEYASGMVRATFAAVPHRGRVLAAKAVVLGAVAFAVGEVGAFAGYAAGQVAIAGSRVPPAALGDPGVWRPVVLTGAYLGLFGLIGLGLGVVIRHTGGAIGTLFGALFVPMFFAAMVGGGGIAVLKFLPMFVLVNSVVVVTPVPGTLSAWAGIGVLCLYAAAVLGFGSWRLRRRDA
jgi:ABC-2 type transport system permease protein